MKEFSSNLFWDVNPDNIDIEEHASFIVQRVLEYGLLEDWNYILSYYGISRILSLALQFRSLDPKALAFISAITKTPRENFRCYITRRPLLSEMLVNFEVVDEPARLLLVAPLMASSTES